MRLTSFTDYGLRALMLLAAEPERCFTTDEIARDVAISRNHLIKIVRALAKAGFVKTRRGKNGGFLLARPAKEIHLGEVVRRLESASPLVECFRSDGGACRMTHGCLLKYHLIEAREAFLGSLDRISLADCAYPAARLCDASLPATKTG